jgi:hypothetical protein
VELSGRGVLCRTATHRRAAAVAARELPLPLADAPAARRLKGIKNDKI